MLLVHLIVSLSFAASLPTNIINAFTGTVSSIEHSIAYPLVAAFVAGGATVAWVETLGTPKTSPVSVHVQGTASV